MKRLIVRADDIGLSEAVTLGILSAYRNGIVTSTGMIVNMPFAEETAQLLKEENRLCLGLHINLIVGRPCADPNRVRKLLDADGKFISSRVRREQVKSGINDFKSDEVEAEIDAQIKRFFELNGKLPEYIDSHSVSTDTTDQVIFRMAEKYGIRQVAIRNNHKAIWKRVETRESHYDFFKEGKPFYQFFDDKYIDLQEGETGLLVVHPGFLDQEILEVSSMTIDRTRDHDMLVDPRVREWLKKKEIKLISFRDL